MKETSARHYYFPAILCAEFDSPIDALLSLQVPQDEVMNLVAATWSAADAACVLATVDGGRHVAALRLPSGRWAACNAYLDQCCASPRDAERRLQKLVRRGRRGCVVTVDEPWSG